MARAKAYIYLKHGIEFGELVVEFLVFNESQSVKKRLRKVRSIDSLLR